MANTTAVYARIDTKLKENAEDILAQLGISPSSAIQMFYSKIVLTRGMPFELRLPYPKPTAIGGMTREELDAELEKGWESMQNERLYSAEEVDKELDEMMKDKRAVAESLFGCIPPDITLEEAREERLKKI